MTDLRSHLSDPAEPDPAASTDPTGGPEPTPPHTGSDLTRWLAVATVPVAVVWMLLSLVWSPPEADMGEAVRVFYVHVPIAILLSVMCLFATVSSAMWLYRRTPGWDGLAVASAELALLYGLLTLGTGAIWGKPTWGTYWTWDPRLTTSALLVVIIFGYHALRRMDPSEGAEGSVPAALVGLLLFPNAIVVRYSVDWWRSLHQDATINTLSPNIQGQQHLASFLGVVVLALVTAWLMVHRFRVSWLEKQALSVELETAVAERRSELAEARAGGSTDDDNPVEGQ